MKGFDKCIQCEAETKNKKYCNDICKSRYYYNKEGIKEMRLNYQRERLKKIKDNRDGLINIYRLEYNGKVIYVGKTKQTLKERKYGEYKFIPKDIVKNSLMILIERTEDKNREDYWVRYYKDKGCILYNKKSGDGVSEDVKRENWNKYQNEYKKINRSDKDKENTNAYQQTDKSKEYRKAYYRKNKEKILEKMKEKYKKGE